VTLIYTASYQTADPDRGAPMLVCTGTPRFVGYPLVTWRTVAPWGLVEETDEATFRRKYRHRLHRLTPKILAELAELQEEEEYAPLPLLLCCFEPPGTWCHRTVLAGWLEEQLGETISELS
jgi:hypothetical protein